MNITLLKGDCLQKLKELEDNSVDSVVTDPPYEIGFMGKGWDDSGIANNPELWKEVLRVLKPGGHLLSFSHSRTYHRQAVAVEDAGFEIRDQIMWVYGSGFPKSHNIGKAVDKLQGNEREVVGKYQHPDGSGERKSKAAVRSGATDFGTKEGIDWNKPITKGNSPYEGWGTALKPAHEPIVMARKPFKGSVAQNVLEWGTGGINIDDSRINTISEKEKNWTPQRQSTTANISFGEGGKVGKEIQMYNTQGRFPANIIFDEEAGKILDEQTGELKPATSRTSTKPSNATSYKLGGDANPNQIYKDTGGASRFFYCPKASKRDRNEGLSDFEEKHVPYPQKEGFNANKTRPDGSERKPVKPQHNYHPTVKPTDLMAYLVRMVTPKGGTVLDPFMGSGSTGKAAVREGFNFIGIEREDEYMKIAEARIEYEKGKNIINKFI